MSFLACMVVAIFLHLYMQVSAVLKSAEIVASLSPPMMIVALGILKESVRS